MIVVPPRGVTLKLARAREQLGQIGETLEAFSRAHIDGVTPVGHLDGRVLTLRLPEDIGELDENVSIAIGELVHNLRSGLDQMTFALLESNIPNLSVDAARIEQLRSLSQFPICDDQAWFDRFVARRCAGLSPRALDVLERFQPFYGGRNPVGDSLWCLRELSNVDKHRLVNPVISVLHSASVRIQTNPIQVPHWCVWNSGPLQGDAVLVKVIFPNHPGQAAVRTIGGVAVALYKDTTLLGDVHSVLTNIYTRTNVAIDQMVLAL